MKDIHHNIWNTDFGFEFNENTLDNDFIILKLGSPLIFDKDVKPACLPSSKDYLGSDSTEDMCSYYGGEGKDNIQCKLLHFFLIFDFLKA